MHAEIATVKNISSGFVAQQRKERARQARGSESTTPAAAESDLAHDARLFFYRAREVGSTSCTV